MLKTTTQQLIDSLGYEGGRVGQPLVVGAAITQDQAARTLYSVPKGHTLLITHVVNQVDSAAHLGVITGSPDAASSFSSIQFLDTSSTQKGAIDLRGFARYQSLFGASPDFRSSAPSNVVEWKPKYPIAVPGGWTVQQAQNSYAWGNAATIYGVVVNDGAARDMGFNTSITADGAAMRMSGVVSTDGATSAEDIMPAIAGKSIRVLDVLIRMQPSSETANTVTLQQTNGTKVFVATNSNPGEFAEFKFSPDWFMLAGQALQIVSDLDGDNSVTISYEYVDADEVPGDVWFSVIEPTAPTPGVGTTGTSSLTCSVSTEATLYYPARGTTETSPGGGSQHILRGYAVSIQKATTTGDTPGGDETEQTKFAISTGATAGQIASSTFGLTQGNYQLSPTFSAGTHDQCVHSVVDGINVPCKKDDGSIWVDVFGFNTVTDTPDDAEADILEFAVNIWGRTTPELFTARTNKGA